MKPCAVRIGKKASGDQLPCEYCKGFFDKRKISIHLKRCFRRKEDSKSSVKSSRILLAATLFDGKFSEVQQKIIPITMFVVLSQINQRLHFECSLVSLCYLL